MQDLLMAQLEMLLHLRQDLIHTHQQHQNKIWKLGTNSCHSARVVLIWRACTTHGDSFQSCWLLP